MKIRSGIHSIIHMLCIALLLAQMTRIHDLHLLVKSYAEDLSQATQVLDALVIKALTEKAAHCPVVEQ